MSHTVVVQWPNGQISRVDSGVAWLEAAHRADQPIPTGCFGGSCGACEIEVNGQVVRACTSAVPSVRSGQLKVEWASDPYW
jgi:ferredoxin